MSTAVEYVDVSNSFRMITKYSKIQAGVREWAGARPKVCSLKLQPLIVLFNFQDKKTLVIDVNDRIPIWVA